MSSTSLLESTSAKYMPMSARVTTAGRSWARRLCRPTAQVGILLFGLFVVFCVIATIPQEA